MAKIQAIRGMNDLLPEQSPVWQYLERTVQSLLAQYGYQEIRMPIVEQTELFKRSIGEVTDIVEKEMYTFEDRNGDSLTLRPEGTASCVRAAEEHGLLFNQTQRLWYCGPMFRHERPQKGRYRQFHQIGVECFGMATPDIDAELIILTAQLWRALGIADKVTLELNSLGLPEERAAFKAELVSYLEQHIDALDEDSRRRLSSNPLRILDSKDQGTRLVLENAPRLESHLGDESREHFASLCGYLDAAGVKYRINPNLVRGLDYYSKTVFEWVTTSLGAQGTVCAGGRYDGLVQQLGGRPTPGVGFAMGVERLVLLLEALDCIPQTVFQRVDVFIVAAGEGTQEKAFSIASQLRDKLGLRVLQNMGGGSFKSQMKKADRSGARICLILGENELAEGKVNLKFLQEEREQETVSLEAIEGTIKKLFKN